MRGGLDHSTFKSRLKKLNPNLRFVYTPIEVSGIYLYVPRKPDVRESGLVHLGSYPSPRHFSRIPQETFFTTKFLDSEGNPRVVKGWNAVVNVLISKKAFTRIRAMKVFKGLMRPYNFDVKTATVI